MNTSSQEPARSAEPARSTVLPPADILAVVAPHGVPTAPPDELRDVVHPVVEDGVVAEWSVATEAMGTSGAVSAYWAWRRTWSSTWGLGPVTNVRGLRSIVDELDHALDHDVRLVLDRIRLCALGDTVVRATRATEVVDGVEHLRTALATMSAPPEGLAIVDDTYAGRRPPSTLRLLVPSAEGDLLASDGTMFVVISRQHGLVVRREPDADDFRDVRRVDLSGDSVLLVNGADEAIAIPQAEARPLGWLAPQAIRWSVRPTPLVGAVGPLLDGLSGAFTAAASAGAAVRFTTNLAAKLGDT